MGRLILTGHSGGGAPVAAILAHADPDEVYVFDGMYGSGANIARWAARRIARELASPGALPPALRILYVPGTGTERHSLAVARELCGPLAAAGAERLRPLFRVDATRVGHNEIPRRFGWQLLVNAAADLPGARSYVCGGGGSREAEAEEEASEHWESPPTEREESEAEAIGLSEGFDAYEAGAGEEPHSEDLAWLDLERIEGEDESGWLEAEGAWPGESEGAYAEQFEEEEEREEEGEEDRFEGEAWPAGEDESAWSEAPLYSGEAENLAGEDEAFAAGRFEEQGDARDAEWSAGETEGEEEAGSTGEAYAPELEGEDALASSGLSPAEIKAVQITSTFETGKRGGFYGLAGNFDGQGLSFGLVSWTIGTGSLQPLLRDFAAEHPARWAAAFGRDAERFLKVIAPKGAAAVKAQHRFAIDQMNEKKVVNGRTRWEIGEPWKTYFRRLSEDSAFQGIQVRHVRVLLARGEHFCRHFRLVSEAAFAFMFDAAASHGKWWLTKKFGGREKRRLLIEEKLRALETRHGAGRVPESDVLLAIADVLAATSAPRWAAKVRERKRWFVTGEHRRAAELRGLQPRLDLPYSATARPVPSPAPAPSPAPPPPSPLAAVAPSSDLAARIVAVAQREHRLWHPEGRDLKEWQDEAVPILQRYYREGVGAEIGAAKLKDAAWQKANPWSAVFISYVMRTAGAGSAFRYSRAHREYIAAARRNRLEGNAGNPFWAYRPGEIAPQPGDLVCAWRGDRPVSYDTIGEPKPWQTHCDVVTEVGAGWLRVVGGNVREDVGLKKLETLPDGKVSTGGKQHRIFAILSCRGVAAQGANVPIAPPAPQPPQPPPGPPPQPPAPAGRKLTPAEFVGAYGAAARESQAASGVPALVTLGQAALESGWGKSAPRFNFFGIKARASDPEESRQLLRTREVLPHRNGRFPEVISITPRPDGRFDYVVKDWFRAYPSARAAFLAHGEFLVRNKRYGKAFGQGGDPYAFAAEVARAGYATDPDYARVLAGVMRTLERAGAR